MKYHVVNRMKTKFSATLNGIDISLDVSTFGHGVVGCLLVFDSEESAVKYYNCNKSDMRKIATTEI